MYKYRRTLLTRTNYFTDRQKQRLDMLWATDDEYVALEVTWMFYQDLIQAYGHPKKSEGKKLMERIINTLRKGLPAGLEELAQLGRSCGVGAMMCSRTSMRGRPMGRSRRSTAGSNIYAASPWDSGTSTTFILVVTDPLRTAANQNQRTLNREEPLSCLGIVLWGTTVWPKHFPEGCGRWRWPWASGYLSELVSLNDSGCVLAITPGPA